MDNVNESESTAGIARRTKLLRWLGVLPAGVIAGWFFAGSVDFLISLVGVELRNSAFPAFVFPLVQLLPSGMAFTVAGALTAPNRRTTTASILAALCILMALQIHVLGQSNPGLTNYMHSAGQSLGALIGIGVTEYLVRRAAQPMKQDSANDD